MIQRCNCGVENVVVVLGDDDLAELFAFSPHTTRRRIPDKLMQRINTKQISIAWDLRYKQEGAGIDVPLNGRRFGCDELPSFYYIHDGAKEVGETGLVSKARWPLSEREQVSKLFWSNEVVHYCSSLGLGGEIEEALEI